MRHIFSSGGPATSDGQPPEANGATKTPNSEHFVETTPAGLPYDNADKSRQVAAAMTPVSWDTTMKEVIPSYVKMVSFLVPPSDLSTERQIDIETRFPGVTIISGLESNDNHNRIGAQFSSDQRMRQPSPPDTISMASMMDPPLPGTHLSTAVEVTQATSRLRLSPTSMDPLYLTSKSARKSGMGGLPDTNSNIPTMKGLARRIGLESSISDVMCNMWSHWQKKQEVMPFTTARMQGCDLGQFYQNLVAMYVLAHHEKKLDLCFAALLAFQSTNYKHGNRLPDVSTATLAFQHLPGNNDLCRWMATLFSFLWRTQQYQDHRMLLAAFPQVDKDALLAFLFAIAYTRDAFTKGHNTAVIDRWCKVHHHTEGDAEATLCAEVYDNLKSNLEEIRTKEAKDEYAEAKKVVEDYEEGLQVHSLSKQEMSRKANKRKAESLEMQPKKEPKRGNRRSGLGRAL